MKNLWKLMILVMIILNLSTYVVFARELTTVENTLKELGVSKEYSENIINYIETLTISQDKLEEIIDYSNKIEDVVGDRRDIKDFKLKELISLYKNAKDISSRLNLNIDYNFASGKVMITAKNTKDILFNGEINELKLYYEKLIKVTSQEDILRESKMILAEIIEEDLNSNENEATINNLQENIAKENNNDNTNINNASVVENKTLNFSKYTQIGIIEIMLIILVAAIVSLIFRAILFPKRKYKNNY